MEIIIFIVIIYFVYLSNSGKKTKTTGGRNIMNEVNNLLTEGAQKIETQLSNKNSLKKAVLKSMQSPKQQVRKKPTLYKKTISIPIDVLTAVDGQRLGVNIVSTIYIKDVEKFKSKVNFDDSKITRIIVASINIEASNMSMNDLLEPIVLKEKVKKLVMPKLAFMGISRIDLEITIKSILQTNTSNSYLEKSNSINSDDYAKQITDDLTQYVGNIENSIEKEIDKTVKNIEKDMDDFVKKLIS